jgi:hypothetical protein
MKFASVGSFRFSNLTQTRQAFPTLLTYREILSTVNLRQARTYKNATELLRPHM